MTASLLWTGHATSSTTATLLTVGTYPSGSYGTSPLMLTVGAGLAHSPNGGSMSEFDSWGASFYAGASNYNSRATPSKFSGGFATHFTPFNLGVQDESHVGYLNSGGNAIINGDSWDMLCGLSAIIGIDDVILNGPPASVDGVAFSVSFNVGALLRSFPVGSGGGGDTWSFHSISGTIAGSITSNIAREVSPFAIALIYGHSSDTPPYGTPDLVNSLPSWSSIGFVQVGNYFAAAALWVPPDPTNPDYSYSFSNFPTSDFGTLAIGTLNLPTLPAGRNQGIFIG